jgi:N-acetylmuramoyl-L-alanine amidase
MSSEASTYSKPIPIDPSVLPLALRTIILDPGHGGDNMGTVAPEGLVEKEVTLGIASRVRELLEQSSYQVLMTRDSDRSLSLRERAEFANNNRGDIFVSIHVNWIANRELRGVETFYLGATDDPYLQELAARENQQSGYSLADFKQILQQVYAGVRQEESRRLGESVQEALFNSLYDVNASVRNRGVKSAPFGVLIWTDMPAILAEVSCVSNRVEARLLMTPIYRQYLAEAIVQGIEAYSRQFKKAYQVVELSSEQDGQPDE